MDWGSLSQELSPWAETEGRPGAVEAGPRVQGPEPGPSGCLLGSPKVFLNINAIYDCFSETTEIYKIKTVSSSHNPSHWCVGFYNSAIHK